MQNKLIVIYGSSGSGKTTLSNKIVKYFGEDKVVVVSQDDYYLGMKQMKAKSFDEPSSLDFKLLENNLVKLINNNKIESPIYNFKNHNREEEVNIILPKDIIILDGTMVMTSEEIKKLSAYSIYCNIDIDICFIRRLQRDILERGRDMNGVIEQYLQDVRPSFFKYIDKHKDKSSFNYDEQNISQLLEDLQNKI